MTGDPSEDNHDAGPDKARRLRVLNGGFLWQRNAARLRRILALSGWQVRPGWPRAGDAVGVWGAAGTAHRGRQAAASSGAALVTIEDAWLRSLFPGRAGGGLPLGLLIDGKGAHFDPAQPSDLEVMLATHPLDSTDLLDRARHAARRMKTAHLTKYYATRTDPPAPEPGYVLVIDQTLGDAAVTASGGDAALFREMLVFAQEEHPGARVLIKTHPETASGQRPGYYGPEDETARVALWTEPASPWTLFEGAVGVYTFSSQLGFEAIHAGHRPRVFGQPFYAGWGLTDDERPVPRRERRLSRAQLFAAAMILYPRWYDPYRDRLCALEEVMDIAEAEARAWRADRQGWVAGNMRLWKRRHVQQFFGRHRRVVFEADAARARTRAAAEGRRLMVWGAGGDGWEDAVRVEDGFLRSRGLGAELVPPVSLVTDDLGIYYDPTRPSRLEALIGESVDLPPDALRRAEDLRARLIEGGVTKYNLGGDPPTLPEGHRILVPGQVEDDASIRLGADAVATNGALLERVRAENPDAVVIYKPHPDVLAGLRPGAVDASGLADLVVEEADMGALLGQVQEVWTITSGTGFEALMRGVPVVTLGAPFYAGWGLTRDLGRVPVRRQGAVSLDGLTHAVLIGYPRYLDPVSGAPCPVEVVVDRLEKGRVAHPGWANRAVSKLQGLFASQAWLWRR